MAITTTSDSIIIKHPAENKNVAQMRINENMKELEQLRIDLMVCADKDKGREIKDDIAALEKRNGYLKQIIEDR